MNLPRALPVVLLLAFSAQAATEECLVDPKVLKPQFAAKLPKGFKLVSTKKDKRQIKQVLSMPEGVEARVTVGGCEHLGFTISFKGPTVTSKTVGAELIAITRHLLPLLPMDKESTVDVKLIQQALEDARISIMPAQLPCGNATCQLSLEAVEAKAVKGKKPPPKAKGKKDKEPEPAAPPAEQPGVLTLSYDLPL